VLQMPQTAYDVDNIIEGSYTEEEMMARLADFSRPEGRKSDEEEIEFEKLQGAIMRSQEPVRRSLFFRLIEELEGVAKLYGKKLSEMGDLLEAGKSVDLYLLTKADIAKLSPGMQDTIYGRYREKTENAEGGEGREVEDAGVIILNPDDFDGLREEIDEWEGDRQPVGNVFNTKDVLVANLTKCVVEGAVAFDDWGEQGNPFTRLQYMATWRSKGEGFSGR